MDVLSTLQECSFRGIAFPVISIKESFSHDTPQHKSVDRDGAFIENTGRNPFVFAIVVPFYAKTIARGKNETWDDLYPTRFESLRNASLDRTTADFVHPLYGTFRVKLIDWDSTLNADERGGQTVALTVMETRDDGEATAFVASSQTRARSTAIDLDSQLFAIRRPIDPIGIDESFLSVIDSLNQIVDTTSLQSQQALAKIDRTIAKLNRVANSIDRAASVFTTDALTNVSTNLGPLGPGSGRIWTNCQVLKACLQELRFRLTANNNRTISMFVVTAPVMLPTLASRLSSTVVELQALNPEMTRSKLTVPANTAIRYYKKG